MFPVKLGIEIGQTFVTKYTLRCRKPPSQTWRTFLNAECAPRRETVKLKLTHQDPQLPDRGMHRWVVPGDCEVMIGKSSADILLQGL